MFGVDVRQLGQRVRDPDHVHQPAVRQHRQAHLGHQVAHHREQVGVAGPLAVAVGGALHVGGAGLYRGDGVGDRATGVVLAVDAEPEAGALTDLGDDRAPPTSAACRRWCRTARSRRRPRSPRRPHPERRSRDRTGSRRRSARSPETPDDRCATRYATVSDTMARFSSGVVRSARSTCLTSDLATRVTDRGPDVQQRLHLRVLRGPQAGLAGGAEGHQRRGPQVQLAGRGPGEELGVLGHRAGPAALDEPDPQVVQQGGHRDLVGHRVGDALALGTVPQGGVEDMEGVAQRGTAPRRGGWLARAMDQRERARGRR